MNFFKAHIVGLACLCLASSALASTVKTEGQDNRVEWKIQQQWPTASKTIGMVHSLDGKYVYILNDKQQVQIFNSKGQLQGTIPVGAGVSSIDIAPQGEELYLIDNLNNSFSSVSIAFVVKVDTANSPYKGAVDAPVVVTVFSDFE